MLFCFGRELFLFENVGCKYSESTNKVSIFSFFILHEATECNPSLWPQPQVHCEMEEKGLTGRLEQRNCEERQHIRCHTDTHLCALRDQSAGRKRIWKSSGAWHCHWLLRGRLWVFPWSERIWSKVFNPPIYFLLISMNKQYCFSRPIVILWGGGIRLPTRLLWEWNHLKVASGFVAFKQILASLWDESTGGALAKLTSPQNYKAVTVSHVDSPIQLRMHFKRYKKCSRRRSGALQSSCNCATPPSLIPKYLMHRRGLCLTARCPFAVNCRNQSIFPIHFWILAFYSSLKSTRG